jgi:CheY-like chemotaxis protein
MVQGMDSDGRTILLVEDTEDDVFFMKDTMKRAGLLNPLHVVRDGSKAIDYLNGSGGYSDRKQFPFPCLVLLDLKLPEYSGFEVLDWIRAQAGMKQLPVVVLSGSEIVRDLSLAYQKGANSYVVKPPTREKLEALTKAVGECWLREKVEPV